MWNINHGVFSNNNNKNNKNDVKINDDSLKKQLFSKKLTSNLEAASTRPKNLVEVASRYVHENVRKKSYVVIPKTCSPQLDKGKKISNKECEISRFLSKTCIFKRKMVQDMDEAIDKLNSMVSFLDEGFSYSHQARYAKKLMKKYIKYRNEVAKELQELEIDIFKD